MAQHRTGWGPPDGGVEQLTGLDNEAHIVALPTPTALDGSDADLIGAFLGMALENLLRS